MKNGIEMVSQAQEILDMIAKRFQKIRKLAMRISSDDCAQRNRNFLMRRFEKLKDEIDDLANSDFIGVKLLNSERVI